MHVRASLHVIWQAELRKKAHKNLQICTKTIPIKFQQVYTDARMTLVFSPPEKMQGTTLLQGNEKRRPRKTRAANPLPTPYRRFAPPSGLEFFKSLRESPGPSGPRGPQGVWKRQKQSELAGSGPIPKIRFSQFPGSSLSKI